MKHVMVSRITMYEKNPAEFEVRTYEASEKKKLLEYMRSFEFFEVAGLIEDCRTGEELREECLGFNDGTFVWSSQDIYHLERYDAAVCEEFIKKVVG